MKTLLDSLMLEVSLRPDLGRLLSALLISSGIILLALVVNQLLRRRSAASRNIVWRIVIAALLVLAFWQLMPRYTPPMTLHIELLASLPQAIPVVVPEPEMQASLPPPAWWEYALSAVDRRAHLAWLSVAVMMMWFHLLRSFMGLRRLSRYARPAAPEVHHICENLLMKNGSARKVICHLVPGLASPLLTGFWKAHIWLPETAMDWSEERLQAVFRHELAHLTRRDLGWQILTALAECLWWWHPLVPAAGRALRAEAEQAADDLAVTSGCDAHGYARTLVEIAAGWAQGRSATPSAGVAMFGSRDNLQHRVRELLRENRWRGQIGGAALVAISIIGFVLLILASTRLEFRPRPQTYTSLAKLVAGGRIVANEGNVNWQEQMADFYGTIIETLESAEMKKRAFVRVRALHPDLKDANVDIRVAQTEGSAIFNVFAVGDQPQYTKVFLDALLDEFVAFRQQIREQGLERALNTFAETVVTKSKELQHKTEKLESFRKANNAVVLAEGGNEAAAKLRKQQTRLEEAKQRVTDLEVMLRDPSSAVGNLERGYTADGTAKLELGRGLTISEQNYQRSKAEAFLLKQEMEFLQLRKPDDKAALADLETRAAKANHLEAAWRKELSQQCVQEKDSLAKQIVILEEAVQQAQDEALEFAAKLAEQERLTDDFQAAKKTHDELFNKVQGFKNMQNIQTDYIAIQEHASNAYADTREGVFQIWKLWTKAKPPSNASGGLK
jgi:beta-lactamase regulating signal transducer with metallopeptidase domain